MKFKTGSLSVLLLNVRKSKSRKVTRLVFLSLNFILFHLLWILTLVLFFMMREHYQLLVKIVPSIVFAPLRASGLLPSAALSNSNETEGLIRKFGSESF